MKSDDRSNSPKVRIAVLGNMDVGKSGKFITTKCNYYLLHFNWKTYGKIPMKS